MYSLIRTRHGYECILSTSEAFPDAEWLALQSIAPLPEGRWYTAYPLTGGSVYAQVGAFKLIRTATIEDFITAYNAANPSGKQRLSAMFAVLVEFRVDLSCD